MKYSKLLAALLFTMSLGACISVAPGPAGPQGATGDTGATGYTGATGSTGYTGGALPGTTPYGGPVRDPSPGQPRL